VVEPRAAAAVFVEGANTIRRQLEGAHDLRSDALDGGFDLRLTYLQVLDVGVVEGLGIMAQRGVAFGTHIVKDALNHLLGAEVVAKGVFDPRPHRRGQSVRIKSLSPAADK
jgi:hypothetical protein